MSGYETPFIVIGWGDAGGSPRTGDAGHRAVFWHGRPEHFDYKREVGKKAMGDLTTLVAVGPSVALGGVALIRPALSR